MKDQLLDLDRVAAEADDGQRLLALNEVFVGHTSHQSARYRVTFGDAEERQSSSGVIVATGPRPAERLLGGASVPGFVTTPICVAALDVALRWLPTKRAVFAVGVDVPVWFSAAAWQKVK